MPKWYGYANDDGRWVDAVDLQPLAEVEAVLAAIGLTGEDPVSRTPTSPLWATSHELVLPRPKIKLQAQAVPDELVEPVIDDGQRALLVALRARGQRRSGCSPIRT